MKKVISTVALVVIAVVGLTMMGCKKDKAVVKEVKSAEVVAPVAEVKAEVTDVKTTNVVDKIEVAPAK